MNLEPESTSISSPDDSTGWFGGLRSRYHAFLEKQKERTSLSRRARLGQGTLRLATFSVLVIVILAVSWVGMSLFGGGPQKAKSDSPEQSANPPELPSANPSANPSAIPSANPSNNPAANPSTNPAANPSATQSASQSTDAETMTPLPLPPPQPEGPAGHAEIRSESTPGKKTDSQ